MRKFAIVGILMVFGAIGISVSSLMAQTTPPLDDTEHIERLELIQGNETTLTQIGRSSVDGSVWTVITDSSGEIGNRPATSDEESFYLRRERFEKVEQWVNNRVAEMIQCETEANSGLLLGNWSTLTTGQQNAVIRSLLDCQEQTSIILKKTLPELLDMFRELDTNGS